MSVLTNAVGVNDSNLTVKKIWGKVVPISITNATTRKMEFGETVFVSGWIGNVIEQDGIAAAATGLIDVNPNRNISMNQVDVADTFAAQKNPIFFAPQTNSAVGTWKDTDASTLVSFKAEVIGSAPAATPAYIEFKPPYQNGDLVATT